MLRTIVLIGIAYLTSIAHAENMVVVHSTATEAFPVGQILDSRTSLIVPENAKIIFVFETGDALSLKGPYQGLIEKPQSNNAFTDPNLIPTLASLVRGEYEPLRKTVLRAASTRKVPQSIWQVNLSNNKRHYCVKPTNRVLLWRSKSESKSASRLLIKHKISGQHIQTMWPAHQSTLVWPKKLPLVYGDTYTVELKNLRGGSSFKKLVLFQLPKNLPTTSHKVVWMAGKGCIPQANRLLASLR